MLDFDKILEEYFTYENLGSDTGDRLCWVKTVFVDIKEVLRSLSCLLDNFGEQVCEKRKWLKSEITVALLPLLLFLFIFA